MCDVRRIASTSAQSVPPGWRKLGTLPNVDGATGEQVPSSADVGPGLPTAAAAGAVQGMVQTGSALQSGVGDAAPSAMWAQYNVLRSDLRRVSGMAAAGCCMDDDDGPSAMATLARDLCCRARAFVAQVRPSVPAKCPRLFNEARFCCIILFRVLCCC